MMPLRQLPNAVSLLRLLLVPGVLWLMVQAQWQGAFWLFAAAGISDAVDGALARILRAETLLGQWLDPLADKVLVACIYVVLAIMGFLPLWLAVLVVLRDVVILVYAGLEILQGGIPSRPLLISKINTLAQIVLAGWILGQLGFGMDSAMLTEALIMVVALTTLASGTAYLIAAHK